LGIIRYKRRHIDTCCRWQDNTPLVIHYPRGYVRRTKVEVVAKDEQVEVLLSNLRERLRGEQGGKIFVVDVPVAIDITTNKRGEEAI
jgi:nitrogen regulatory protein PII